MRPAGGALHVNVPDREEYGDAATHHGIEHFFDDFHYVAVGRRNDKLRIGGNIALRIAEEIKNEKSQENQDPAGPFPAGNEAESSGDERRQGKFVRVLYHDLAKTSLFIL